MLASVAARPVFRSGPWRAQVQRASESVFQPLMACGCFCAAVPGSGLPAGVSLFLGLSVSPSRAVLLLMLPCPCVSVFVQKGLEIRVPFVPWIVPCSCQDAVLVFSGFLCLHFPRLVSWCASPGHCCRSQVLSSFPGTSMLWLRMCLLPGF